MRSVTLVALSLLTAVIASPVGINKPSEDLAKRNSTSKRGNGSEIWYIVTCNGEPHGSTAAYYYNWEDSKNYGDHLPDHVTKSDFSNTNVPGFTIYENDSDGGQDPHLEGFDFYGNIWNNDPSWWHQGGSGSDNHGGNFNCLMDNGRQLFWDCFSNWYCQ